MTNRHARLTTISWIVLLACPIILLTPTHTRAEFRTPIAIQNATIVTGTGITIEHGTIVVNEGRISAIGAQIDVPASAEIIDGEGLIVYPGFIDAHQHLGIPEDKRTEEERQRLEDENPNPIQGPLAQTRFANRRGIRAHLRAVDLYTPNEALLSAHRAAGFTSALIAPRDGLLSGTSALVNLSDAPLRRAVVKNDVALHASFQTGEDGAYPRTLLGVMAQFRQFFLDAQWQAKLKKFHQRHPASTTRAPTDVDLEAIQPVLIRFRPIIIEANTEREIRRALNLASEFKLDVIISGAQEAWKVVDRLKAEHVPLIVSLRFPEEPNGEKKEKDKSDSTASADDSDEASHASDKASHKEKTQYEPLRLQKERHRLWEQRVANTVRLHEAGIPFAIRTRDLKKPSKLFKNLRMVIKRGLPVEAAIAALTRNAARLLKADNQMGTIAPGKLANLTLASKPIDDKDFRVKLVLIDGKQFKIDPDEGDKNKKDEKRAASSSDKADQPDDATPPATQTQKTSTLPSEPATEEKGAPTWQVELKKDRIPTRTTGGNVLIQNGTILPITSETIDHGSILIRNGKIAAIGRDLIAPAGFTVIDAAGRFVIPGFVDCHSHLGVDAVNESVLAISAEVRMSDVINPDSVGLYRAVAGGTTTHHVMHGSSNPIGGQNIIMKTKYGRSAKDMLLSHAPQTIKFALGENVMNSNFYRNWGKRYPNTRMGVEATIRTALEAGRQYQAQWDAYKKGTNDAVDLAPPRRDLRLEALAGILAGDITVHSHCYRSDEILRLMQVAEDFGFRIGTLQHVLEGYRIGYEIARHGAAASTFANDWAYKLEAYGAIPHNAALMTRFGINASVNSDSPNTIRFMGQEAAKSIRWGGLNKTEALSLVTINPAMQLQIADRIGSLEVGKDGDIAIFNGHPLNTFSKCVMTLIDGEVFFEDARPEPTSSCRTVTLPGNPDMSIPDTSHRAYAIVGATIHPISGPVIENGTVVIMNNTIHDVGTDIDIPPGAGIIDATGQHVYPGLIDAGSQLGMYEIGSIRGTRDASEIADLSPQLHAASAVHPHSVHIRIARSIGITTTLAQPSGRSVFGQSALLHLDGWTMPEMLIREPVALHMRVPSLPARMPKGDEQKERIKKLKEDHKKAVKKLDELFAKAKHYAKVSELSKNDPTVTFDVDLALEAMIPYVLAVKPVVFHATTYKQILDALDFAEKHKLRAILSGAQESWKLAERLAKKKIPVILATPLGYPRGEFEAWDSVYRCAGVLDRAGVEFCFASGSAAEAYNLGTQIGMAVAHGLPQERAEFAATLGAARILGLDDVAGSIEVGKAADLIVATDSPLQTTSVVTHMFIEGRPIELTSLHTENYEKFRHRPKPKLPPPLDLKGPPRLSRPIS